MKNDNKIKRQYCIWKDIFSTLQYIRNDSACKEARSNEGLIKQQIFEKRQETSKRHHMYKYDKEEQHWVENNETNVIN